MKYQNREKMYEVNVWELKKYVLEVADYYQLKQMKTAILLTCCLTELQDLIRFNKTFQHMIFKSLKTKIEHETEAKMIEQHLVYMKLLLNWKDSHYVNYRISFLKKLKEMVNPYLTSDLYILMRHLVKGSECLLNNLIVSMDLLEDEIQKYFLCEIYLIEEDYKMAYTNLKDCRYVGVLCEYDMELRAYSLYKYYKYALKEPFFKFNNMLGDTVWMKNQLKY